MPFRSGRCRWIRHWGRTRGIDLAPRTVLITYFDNCPEGRGVAEVVQHEMSHVSPRDLKTIPEELVDRHPVVAGYRFIGEPGRADDRKVRLAVFNQRFHFTQIGIHM